MTRGDKFQNVYDHENMEKHSKIKKKFCPNPNTVSIKI